MIQPWRTAQSAPDATRIPGHRWRHCGPIAYQFGVGVRRTKGKTEKGGFTIPMVPLSPAPAREPLRRKGACVLDMSSTKLQPAVDEPERAAMKGESAMAASETRLR